MPRRFSRSAVREAARSALRMRSFGNVSSARGSIRSGPRRGGRRGRLGAEIGELDLGVPPHLLRRPLGDLAAEVEDVDAVGKVHDDAHVVLDHEDRGALLLVHVEDEAGHVLLLLVVHAGHRLVEEEELRLERERPRKLHALLQAVRQRVHHLLAHVLDLEEVDDLLDYLALGDLLALAGPVIEAAGEEAGPLPEMAADEEVVEHRHALEERDVLEGPRDAESRAGGRAEAGDLLALEPHLSLRGPVDAADAVDEARLAGAVGPDDGHELAIPDL